MNIIGYPNRINLTTLLWNSPSHRHCLNKIHVYDNTKKIRRNLRSWYIEKKTGEWWWELKMERGARQRLIKVIQLLYLGADEALLSQPQMRHSTQTSHHLWAINMHRFLRCESFEAWEFSLGLCDWGPPPPRLAICTNNALIIQNCHHLKKVQEGVIISAVLSGTACRQWQSYL